MDSVEVVAGYETATGPIAWGDKPEKKKPILAPSTAPARNSPCPCASGKKFKRCCLDKTPTLATAAQYITHMRFREERKARALQEEFKSQHRLLDEGVYNAGD